jgi:hypothetical protein
MNKEQQELLDEVYVNYTKALIGSITFSEREKHFKSNGLEFNSGYPNYIHHTQEEFINKCKTDTEFSERWGLKIEERTTLEQVDQTNPVLKGSTTLYPRKLITITYNDTKLESYE